MEKREISTVPEYKKKIVDELVKKMKNSKTVLIASTKGLPSGQFQEIKKKLRGKAEIMVAKKSLVLRAIGKVEKGALQNLKEQVGADIALFFSNLDAFELSGLLADNQSPTKAKAGDIAPEDITVEPGPTNLMPGPAISELGAVGLKVSVENGKLAIRQQTTIVKAGGIINDKIASVMAKLNITPMKVGFLPLAAYDGKTEKVYVGIKIDKKGTLEALKEAISKSAGFAINIKYVTSENVKFFIAKAGIEGLALEKLVSSKSAKEEVKEENNDQKTTKEEA